MADGSWSELFHMGSNVRPHTFLASTCEQLTTNHGLKVSREFRLEKKNIEKLRENKYVYKWSAKTELMTSIMLNGFSRINRLDGVYFNLFFYFRFFPSFSASPISRFFYVNSFIAANVLKSS